MILKIFWNILCPWSRVILTSNSYVCSLFNKILSMIGTDSWKTSKQNTIGMSCISGEFLVPMSKESFLNSNNVFISFWAALNLLKMFLDTFIAPCFRILISTFAFVCLKKMSLKYSYIFQKFHLRRQIPLGWTKNGWPWLKMQNI